LAALKEAEGRKSFLRGSLTLACELFAAAEFEATPNAQFLMFTSVLEVLAKPARRYARCVRLVEKLLAEAKSAQERAAKEGSAEVAEAFKSLQDSAKHLKNESINGSVRRLAVATSRALGDPEPKNAGKRAAALYGTHDEYVVSLRAIPTHARFRLIAQQPEQKAALERYRLLRLPAAEEVGSGSEHRH
jgi:hypothetical protein